MSMKPEASLSFQAGDWMEGTPYRVVRPLGVGGMGEVYEVDHTRTGTRRAVKVARPLSADALLPQRLIREARALRAIDHPNVVRVFEVGALPDGRPYFAMELLDGACLRHLIVEQSPMVFVRAVRLILQALDGLAAIQAQGLVHRDVKPSNLFVDVCGVVKVLDLGIVKSTNPYASGPRTRDGMVLGTTRYMAPEQLSGACVDARADVYSAGLVLVELLVGRKFRNSAWRRDGSPNLPRDLPSGLASVIGRALAREPEQRFSCAEELASALRLWVPVPPVAPRRRAPVLLARSKPVLEGRTRCTATQVSEPPPQARAWLWGVQLGLLVFALFAMVIATGVTWRAVRSPALDPARCSAATVSSSLPAGTVGEAPVAR
jgi:serine/threonine protein kinase